MDKDEKSKKDWESEKDWHGDGLKYWRAWGSWFSWGSPVGLGLGYALVIISTGVFMWLLAHR